MRETRRNTAATLVLAVFAGALIAPVASAQNTFTVAGSEQFFTGTLVSGSYLDTHTDDGVAESIEEIETGGKPSKRQSKLEHLWAFTLPAGSAHTLHLKAWLTDSGEGEAIDLRWSDDDQTYTPLLTYGVGDSGTIQSAPLPPSLSGVLLIWIQDSDRTPGNRTLDTFSIDWLVIETVPQGGPPPLPAAPTNLRSMDLSPSAILIAWEDNATTEDGYRVKRSLDGMTWTEVASLAAETTRYEDDGLQPATTYHYVVCAHNESGDSPLSDVATRTTRPLGAYGITFVDAVSGILKDHDHHPTSGLPGIAYSSDAEESVRFAEFDGQAWTVEIVCSGGWGLEFAYAPSGAPSICHLLDQELRFLERAGNTWVAQVIDTQVVAFDYPSLAYDGFGEPAIAYRKQGGPKRQQGLWLARRANGLWMTELVDPRSSPRYISLDFDAQGHPALAYSDDLHKSEYGLDTLKFTRWDGSSWDVQVLETGVSGYGVLANLTFDPVNGLPAICHDGNRVLVHDGTTWQLLPLFEAAEGQVVHDPTGTLHVGHRIGAEIWLTTWSGTWQHERVEPGRNGGWAQISVHLDPLSQQPSLSYTGGMLGPGGVKYAQR